MALLFSPVKYCFGGVTFRPVNSAVLFWAEDSGEMRRRRDAAARLIHATYIYRNIYNYYQSETVRLYSGPQETRFYSQYVTTSERFK